MNRQGLQQSMIACVAGALLSASATAAPNNQEADSLQLSASVMALIMERDFGADVEGSSGSVSLLVDVDWSPSALVTLGGQFVQVNQLFEDGRDGAAYWLSNDDLSLINALYVDFDFASIGWEKSGLKAGRLLESYDFFPAYKVRHKAQAWEGAVFETELFDGLSVDVGHIERFSSWSCREDGSSSVNADFMTLSERYGYEGGDSGVQFLSTGFKAGPYSVTAYDYYADDFYNNVGIKVDRSFKSNQSEAVWTVTGHYNRQDGISGGYLPDFSAELIELSLGYKKGSLNWNSGWTHVGSQGNFQTPFRTSYNIDATLLWYTNQFEAGTDTLHVKGTYKLGAWTLYGMLLGAEHADDRKETEANVVVKYSFENQLWVAFKGGYGTRDFAEADRDDAWARDLRLFMGYAF